MRHLQRRQQEIAAYQLKGGCMADTAAKTAMDMAVQVGIADGMEKVIDLTFEEMETTDE